MSMPRKDEVSGVETTGHEWDGLEELNNPLPRWWLWVFLATIVWSVGYWVLMPAWPLVSDHTRGVLGYSQRAVVAEALAEAKRAQGGYAQRLAALPAGENPADPDLQSFALSGGRSAYAVNCSQCHGSGAAGAKGYPNLNDDDWLWGGTLAEIERTLRVGIRGAHAETRVSDMPAFGRDGILTPAQIGDVADFVRSLSEPAPASSGLERGKALFAENCAACHGETGRGNRELGAPNLADALWLYGGDKASVVASIAASRRGVMPAWEGRLDDVTIRQLAIYVHSLGGGE
ncbi:MAG: cytochrome-c oxidase, cbb3-type subunit III [Alphaproteobacteria bacterium]